MEKKRLYFAASLFNLADKYFNAELSDALSEHFQVILPQKEGFEFSKLHSILEEVVDKGEIPKDDIENITNHLIYYLDIGYLLPQSDFCLSRLDEPMDPGVDIETMAAKDFRIPVIGYRTDIRTPYGSASSEVRGAHFFPAYNCDILINFTSKSICNAKEGRKNIKNLADLIYKSSQDIIAGQGGQLPHKIVNFTSGNSYVGKALFQGIGDLHSHTGLKEVVRRYTRLKEAFGNTIIPNNIEIVQA